MGRAITILSFLVLLSFGFVFYQLWIRRPAGAGISRGPAPLLETRDDGSVYAVSLEIDRFERRLVEEEKRWVKLQSDLEAMRAEREELKKTIEGLQGDVRRLRRQLNGRPAPAPAAPTEPAAPEGTTPGEGTVLPAPPG